MVTTGSRMEPSLRAPHCQASHVKRISSAGAVPLHAATIARPAPNRGHVAPSGRGPMLKFGTPRISGIE